MTTKATDTRYIETFLEFLHKQSLKANYLVLPGDVSELADPSEFKLASEFISEVVRTLHLRRDRLIFVPGNHDVDWTVLGSSDPTGVRRHQRYDPLRHREWIFAKIM